ncbi:MAG TPA: IS1595 family transposase [Candidatus Brocadiia bacterium]|nr:IS1595 family transposase [Candidatus Brocadiia bacterium]
MIFSMITGTATRRYEERSLLEFQKAFGEEEACLEHLQQMRWQDGFMCPRCGHDAAWLIRTRGVMDCKKCRAKTSVTAGTIFHKTRTPLLKWYWLIYRMATDKVGTSVAEMQRLLDIRDYKTAWMMAHKIRKAMADRDARYTLAGLVELDDSFFGPPGHTLGRGSERKSTVLCAVSLYTDAKGKRRPGFAHMRVVEDASARSIGAFLESLGCGVETEQGRQLLEAIQTDGWRSYRKAAEDKEIVHYRVVLRDASDAGRLLPWVHRVISNVKSVISGTHRGVSAKHLHSYMGEVCYRFNRRFWERQLFDRLIKACVSTPTVTYDQLVSRESL